MSMSEKVVTRFAPSPTGLLHGGNYRTAVFAYLFAKQQHGEFIVRIEDTDRERSKKEYEENILETLSWLGLLYDRLYRQSEHTTRHQAELRRLIESGAAYISKEEPKEEGQRAEVIRFKNPNTEVTFEDAIRGPITFNTTDLGDFVIARSETEPVFHFAVVVDDADEGVTHVVRGEDHISNTPRQILIQRALGYPAPVYAHLPLVLGPDRSKLSKRRGAKALTQYRSKGYLPEAIINYLALLGWHPEGEQELFSVSELVAVFDLARTQKSAGIFDEVKLHWFNHEHLKRLSDEEFGKRLTEFLGKDFDTRLLPLVKERAQTLAQAAELLAEYDFLATVAHDKAMLLNNGKISATDASKHLSAALGLLEALADEDFTPENVKSTLWPYAEQEGRGAVLWPVRVALSGKEKSPDPFVVAALLGKQKTLERIAEAVRAL